MKRTSALNGAAIGLFLVLGAQTAGAACKSNELSLRWPVGGTDGTDWVINNYVDLDTGKGLRDYRNNTGDSAKTYNGHGGIDIDLPTFRNQDAGVWATAAAAGTVVTVQSNLFDRNFEGAPGCGAWNHVEIKHANGYRTFYGHLRLNGVSVKAGDTVTQGQRLGLIGSSGCSSTSHLHFEVRNCSNGVVEPFAEGMFVSPPAYDTAHRLMDISIRKGAFPDPAKVRPADAVLKDPQPNVTTFSPGSRIGIGLSMAGGQPGQQVAVQVVRPGNTVYSRFEPVVYTVAQRHGWPRWWTSLPDKIVPGTWRVEVRLDGTLARTFHFTMVANRDAILQGAADTTYQQNFQSLTGDQYRPISVDGSTSPTGAAFSAVFRRTSGQYAGFHNLEGAQYQTEFNKNKNANLQLTALDMYVRDGKLMMAGVFSKDYLGTRWEAYHMMENAEHQKRFTHLKDHHMRPYAIAVAVLNGKTFVSAAYTDDKTAGQWTARHNMTADQYQEEFTRQTNLKRAPIYLKAYNDGGTPKFSAIWTEGAGKFGTVAKHGLNESAFFREHENNARAGMNAKAITSYLVGGRRLYAGVWSTAP